jgi:hypothetical protein
VSPPPRHRRLHLSPAHHLAGHRDHPGLAAARARHRHPFSLSPLRLHLGIPEFQLLLGNRLPLGIGVSVLPALDLRVSTTPSVLGGPSSAGTRGVSLSSPASPNPPFRLDWATDLGGSRSLNRRPDGATFSADVAVSLVYEFDAVSFGQCRRDSSGQELCFADFLHEPSGTMTIALAGDDGLVSSWAASAGIEIFNLHVWRDRQNLDRLEIGLPVGLAYQVDPTGASVSAQAGVAAEYHFTQSVSVVVTGNVTFTPDAQGVNVGAGGTATLLIHGS